MDDPQQQPDRITFAVAEGPNTEGHADMARLAHATGDAEKARVLANIEAAKLPAPQED